MAKKQNTLVNDILGFLGGLTDFLPRPLETPYQMVRRDQEASVQRVL